MRTADEQLEFASLAFPADRKTLRVGELAQRLDVTEQHVLDLIEELEIQAVNVAGAGPEFVRVPASFLERVAMEARLPLPRVLEILEASKAGAIISPRKHWRVPVEAYKQFISRRHSFNQG